MKIAVVGTGYVGLVTGACFAEMGNDVICVDINSEKIENLRKGILPIYEPGLEDIVQSNFQQGRLHFSTSLKEAMIGAAIVFIAVGTPPGEDGSADLQYVMRVAAEIGELVQNYVVVVNKSTVPVGTADLVETTIRLHLGLRGSQQTFDVVSNPEFLKEGAAVEDFMRPDRIIVGTTSPKAQKILRDLYAPFNRNHQRLIFMRVRDAEMTKYAANAMLATKISFMNEIANLCERLDVDVENVRIGIGADERIGYHFIYPGVGYGGSCFPKDVKALINMADKEGFNAAVLKAVEFRNTTQKSRVFEKIVEKYDGELEGRIFAIWGLAFKPGTDDMREAPSLVLINSLIKAGAAVQAYDPVAAENAKNEINPEAIATGAIKFTANHYEAIHGADALILLTEWKQFRNPDYALLKREMKSPVIFDGRNQYDPVRLKELGFEYRGIGRDSQRAQEAPLENGVEF